MKQLPPWRRAEFEALLQRVGATAEHVTTAHKLAWLKSIVDRGDARHTTMDRLIVGLRVYSPGGYSERMIQERALRAYLRQEIESGRCTKRKQPKRALSREAFQGLLTALKSTDGPMRSTNRKRLAVAALIAWHTGLIGKRLEHLRRSQLHWTEGGLLISYVDPRKHSIEFFIDRSDQLGELACDEIEAWLGQAPRNIDCFVIPHLIGTKKLYWDKPATHFMAPGLRKAFLACGYAGHNFTFGAIRQSFLNRTYEEGGASAVFRVSGFGTYEWLRKYRTRQPSWSGRSLIDEIPALDRKRGAAQGSGAPRISYEKKRTHAD